MGFFILFLIVVAIIAAGVLLSRKEGFSFPLPGSGGSDMKMANHSITFMHDFLEALSMGQPGVVEAWQGRAMGLTTDFEDAIPQMGRATQEPFYRYGRKQELTRLVSLFTHDDWRTMLTEMRNPGAARPLTPEQQKQANEVEMLMLQGQMDRDRYAADLQQITKVNEADVLRMHGEIDRLRFSHDEEMRMATEQMELRIKEEAPRAKAGAEAQERVRAHERWLAQLNMIGLVLQTTVLVKTELRNNPLGEELVQRFSKVYEEVRKVDPKVEMDADKITAAVEAMMLKNMGLLDAINKTE